MNLISTGNNPTLYRAMGCLQCGGIPSVRRVALYELMPVHGLGRVLLDGSTDEIFEAAVASGMRTLRDDCGVRQSLAGVDTNCFEKSAGSPATDGCWGEAVPDRRQPNQIHALNQIG